MPTEIFGLTNNYAMKTFGIGLEDLVLTSAFWFLVLAYSFYHLFKFIISAYKTGGAVQVIRKSIRGVTGFTINASILIIASVLSDRIIGKWWFHGSYLDDHRGFWLHEYHRTVVQITAFVLLIISITAFAALFFIVYNLQNRAHDAARFVYHKWLLLAKTVFGSLAIKFDHLSNNYTTEQIIEAMAVVDAYERNRGPLTLADQKRMAKRIIDNKKREELQRQSIAQDRDPPNR